MQEKRMEGLPEEDKDRGSKRDGNFCKEFNLSNAGDKTSGTFLTHAVMPNLLKTTTGKRAIEIISYAVGVWVIFSLSKGTISGGGVSVPE